MPVVELRYYLCCPKCYRVMAGYFTYCGVMFGCGTRRDQGVWVREERTVRVEGCGGSDSRMAITLEDAKPFDFFPEEKPAPVGKDLIEEAKRRGCI